MTVKELADLINAMITDGKISGNETLILDGIDGSENHYVWEPNNVVTCWVDNYPCDMLMTNNVKEHTHVTLAYKET